VLLLLLLLLLLGRHQLALQSVDQGIVVASFVQQQAQFFFHDLELSLQNLHSAGVAVAAKLRRMLRLFNERQREAEPSSPQVPPKTHS
jgi:hypothetical protein